MLHGELRLKAYICVKEKTCHDLEKICEPFDFKLSVSCGDDERTGEFFYIFTGPLKKYSLLSSVLQNDAHVTYFGLDRITLAAYLYYTEGADFLGVRKK